MRELGRRNGACDRHDRHVLNAALAIFQATVVPIPIRDPLGFEILDRLLAVQEQVLGELVGTIRLISSSSTGSMRSITRAEKPSVRHGATLALMPTAHPRHTITETPPVREALDELRARLGGERIDYAELVVLGARTKARQLPDDAKAAREAARRLAEMVRRRAIPVDVQAAEEVKRLGLIVD